MQLSFWEKEEHNKDGNVRLASHFCLDTSPRFIAFVRLTERVSKANKLADDFGKVIARVNKVVADRRMD